MLLSHPRAPTLRHCPLTPKGLNRAKSTPFMMVEAAAAAAAGHSFRHGTLILQDSSDDEAKKEIPMSPFLTTPNPVKQTKAEPLKSTGRFGPRLCLSSALHFQVPSLVDTTEAAGIQTRKHP